jgi:DNA-binding MarR family transcriptional regulator
MTQRTATALAEAGTCCSKCQKPFPARRRAPKTGLCRHCWSVKALANRVGADRTAPAVKPAHSRAKDDRIERCMAILRRAADDNAPCPSNADLADMLGYSRPDKASGVIALLEVAGLITVERGMKNRVVTICATGRKTFGSVVRKASKAWSEDDDAILMDGIAQGLTFEKVGRILRKSKGSCISRFNRLKADLGWQAV